MPATNNVTLPEPLLDRIRTTAEAEHRSVDEVLTDAVSRYLDNRSWTNLFSYGAERAAALSIKESDVDRLIADSRREQRGRF